MPSTRLTRERLRNHWQYGKWVYVVILAAAYFLGSMVYTMTAYRSPADRRVEFHVVTDRLRAVEPMQAIAQGLLPEAQEYDPTLEVIDVIQMMYSGDPETDMYGAQKFYTFIQAGEGNVYLLPEALMVQMAQTGGALELDAFIQSGALDVAGLDLSGVTFEEPVFDEDEDETGAVTGAPRPTHVYAIPCKHMARLAQEDTMLDIDNLYMVVMGYCKNPDTTAFVLNAFMEATR